MVPFLADFSNGFSSPSFQTQSSRKSGLCLLQQFINTTGDNGGWHSVFNLSQDINASIQINFYFFLRVRWFSFKRLWLLYDRFTALMYHFCVLDYVQYQSSKSRDPLCIYSENSLLREVYHTRWKSGFANTHERHHSRDQHMTILEKDKSLLTVHLSHSWLFM